MLLIKNGHLLTMTDEKHKEANRRGLVGERLDLLCVNKKIERIAPQIEMPKSAELEVLDASGCLVTPGLIDAHCHVRISSDRLQ